ncbi:unnamed protein product [Scytosiphon promiscuus]
MKYDSPSPEPESWKRSAAHTTRPCLSKGGVVTRSKARHQFMRRFLYSDLQPLTEGIVPDPHPEGPSSIPAEAPADIREELTKEWQREGIRKAAVSTRLPRLTEAAASRDAFLKAAGHTAQGSQSLRICEEKVLAKSFEDGDALSSVLEAQRRDLWFDRAKVERDDLGRESRMLHEALNIIRGQEDVVDPSIVSQGSGDGTSNRGVGACHPQTNSPLDQAPSSESSSVVAPSNGSMQESKSGVVKKTSGADSPNVGNDMSPPRTPSSKGGDNSSVRTTESKIDEIHDRQLQVQQVAQAQELLTRTKKTAMDFMFLAEKADQEASKEADRLQDMQRAPSHSEEALFDNRVGQRRVWVAKNEVALQSRLRYQEAVAALHRVQAEWGPTLGLQVASRVSPRTTSSTTRTALASSGEGSKAIHQADVPEGSASTVGGEADGTSRTTVRDETICVWVIGLIAVNISGETLSRAYYGSFSEADTVPLSGWMAFEKASKEISVSSVDPKRTKRQGKQKTVKTWVVDGSSLPEVNGRYMERGTYDGVPRYRNPNNIFLFRHTLSCSEELGITRQTCLPESELLDEDAEPSATTTEVALGREVSGRTGMDFSRLVKTSLQSINLDRQEKVRLDYQRIARAEAKVDAQFQEQMSMASATLNEVESGGIGIGSVASSAGRRTEQPRGLAIMAASDSAKLTFQESTSDGDRVIPCDEHGAAPLCKRWVARACPKNQINCRCRHYFISASERDRMVAWREGKCARAELEVLGCIAKRESILSEAQKEGAACSRRFLAETRTVVQDWDVASLLRLLDQLRLASVRVVEAICVWREDRRAARAKPASSHSSSGTRPSVPGSQGASGAAYRQGGQPIDGGHGGGTHAPAHDHDLCPLASGPQAENGFPEDSVSGSNTGFSSVDPTPSDLSVTNQTGNKECNGCSDKTAINKRKIGKLLDAPDGGGMIDKGGINGGRIAKGRWVATMMVPGRKLWDSSPAMMSQYKRHRRSRQDPKIARDQLYLGVFATKNEAIEAYDDALCREAVKQRSSVLRMPKKRVVTRTCGKHMAVQSDDTPPGRPCEQCAAEELNGGVQHSPPYIWNNSNYLLKMTEDLDFLTGVDPLVSWLATGYGRESSFELEGNPFSLAPPTDEKDDMQTMMEGSERESPDSIAPPAITAGCGTRLENPQGNRIADDSAPAPGTAPPSLAVSSSRRGNNQAEEDSAASVSASCQEEQKRAWTTPAVLSRCPDYNNGSCHDREQLASAATSCAISAVTTPRAAWAEEGDSIVNDARLRGGSIADDGGAPAAVFWGDEDSAEPISVKDGSESGTCLVPASAVVRNPPILHQPMRATFGRPTTKVTRFSNGVQEWCGEAAMGGRFIIPFAQAFNSNSNNQQEPRNTARHQQLLTAAGVGPGFPPRQEAGESLEVLDLERVEVALAILHEEQDIADAMSGKPPRRRPKHQLSSQAANGGGISGGAKGRGDIAARDIAYCDSATAATVPVGVDQRADANRGMSPSITSAGMSGTRAAEATRAKAAGDGTENTTGAASGRGLVRGRRMRDVLAVYRHRGAQLVLEQRRKRHPFRMDGVFCRQDRGEWAGQVHMSVNAKKFVARRLLDKVLERRNEQRGRIGRMMHRLIEQGQPIHRLAGPRLRALLSKARGLGGDRLTIDIMEAEAALRLYGRVEKSATVIQAFVRGVFGREASWRFLARRREEARLKLIAMTAAGAVAEEYVAGFSQKALQGAKRLIRRPATASVGVFQDGRMMIVSALPLEQRGFGGGAPKATAEWHQLCSACQGRSAHRVWSCKRNTEEIFRGVCSCSTIRPPESVKLTAHDPVTGEQVRMTVSGKQLTQYLSRGSATERVDRRLEESEAKMHVAAAARLLPVPWDAVLGYGNPRREAGTIIRRFWEPCHEARTAEKAVENALLNRLRLCEASRLAHQAAAKASLAAETARVRHETWKMRAEDVASRRRELVLKFLWESEQSREALAFSWRSVQQMEDRKAEDWTQPWDPFENGNNWRQLVRRRATDRALSSSTQAGLLARDSVYRAREDRAAWKQWAEDARIRSETAEMAVNKASARVDRLHSLAKAARNAANEALKMLTILSRPTVKAAGQLKKRLVIEDGSHDREQWDALFRGGMVLETPELSYVGPEESTRRFCVATVRRNAKTGTVSVTAAGDDKAVNLYSVTMSAAEVMSVVSEKVGGRRGKELIAPIVMNGAYTAIRRVQEARRKEILQVFVKALELDIYQNELAVGKLFFIRRTAELKSRLYESLWYQDVIAGRSRGRGIEILRQFHRLGTGWATVVVYETWGDLFFEAYDPATTCTMTLQAGLTLREVLQSLWPNRAATAAFLHAVRTGTFPRKLLRQVLNRLDIILPGENGSWWRRPIDGETPHLALLGGRFYDGIVSAGRNACGKQHRGPIWIEERFTSGKPVTARVLVSARGDFLIEMEGRDVDKRKQKPCGGVRGGHEDASRAPAPCAPRASREAKTCHGWKGVVRLEVRAHDLRVVFRALDTMLDQADSSMEKLLAPDHRAELCRYLLNHIAIEDVRPSTTSADANVEASEQRAGTVLQGSRPGTANSNVDEADVELREAYKSFKAWATAVKAPIDVDPLRGVQQEGERHQHLQQRATQRDYFLSPSEFSLVLRPDIDSDEHLLPIHEGPWTPDGKAWYQAKISLLQSAPATRAATASVALSRKRRSGCSSGDGSGGRSSGDGQVFRDKEVGESAGLSVTLRPEGAGQRRVRLEGEAMAAMAAEDEKSKLVCRFTSRLEREAAARAAAVEGACFSSRFAEMAFTARARSHNRIEALLNEERALVKTWAEQDFRSARKAGLEALRLLRLEKRNHGDGRQGDLMTLRIAEGNTADKDCSDTRGLLAKSRTQVPGFQRPFASKGRRESAVTTVHGAVNAGAGKSAERRAPKAMKGATKQGSVEQAVEPMPLRSASVRGAETSRRAGVLVAPEHRYRGENSLERREVVAKTRSRILAGDHDAAAVAQAVTGTGGALPCMYDEDRPLLLEQQVLRLEGAGDQQEGTVAAGGRGTASMSVLAVVRVVLEAHDARCACGRDQDSRHEGRCEMRGVIRVEAYLPDSSVTLTLRIKVPPTPGAARRTTVSVDTAAVTSSRKGSIIYTAATPLGTKVDATSDVQGKAASGSDSNSAKEHRDRRATKDEDQQLSLHADARWQEMCQWRKRRRRALREACNAETERYLSELLTAGQHATINKTSACDSHPRSQVGRSQNADGSSVSGMKKRAFGSQTECSQREQRSDAFSMLLIRANVVVPISRLHLGSGSWREAIGELVGCPDGQQLRTLSIDGPLVFALDPSCPAAFNVKAEKLLGIRVQGDVVWVQARAEEQVLSLLEADGQVTGRESEAVDELGGDRAEKLAMVEQRGRRYDQAVQKAARRMLPALSRSFFRASVNGEDAAAAEVRCLLNRAWLSPTSEIFGSPFDGENGLRAGLEDADGSQATSTLQVQVRLRPWDVAKDLLKMHVLACKIPGAACPVPCCYQSRAVSATSSGAGSAAYDADAAVLRELDRSIMWFWQSRDHMRRKARKEEGRPSSSKKEGTNGALALTVSIFDPKEDSIQRRKCFDVSPPQASTANPRRPSTTQAGGGQGKSQSQFEATRSIQLSSPRRPFVNALQALERLTSAAVEPHEGVSSAVSSSVSITADKNAIQALQSASSSSSARFMGSKAVEGEERMGEQRRPQAAGGNGGRLGETASMSSGGYRCRVGFDMVSLLTGPDGEDAGGTPVGVRPGEDVESAVLGGCGSQVSRWVVGRLKMGIATETLIAQRNTVEYQQALCLDDTHIAAAVCISGTRFLLTIAQLVDGSVSVSGHDPLTCQTSALTLNSSAAKALTLSEGLQITPKGKPCGAVIAKHLVRNATRLLEVTTVDGVDTLSLTGYNRGDNDSLASSTSSGALVPDVGLEPREHSPRHHQVGRGDACGTPHTARDGDNDRGAELPPAPASTPDVATEMDPVMTAGRTSLIACRIRRLEAGRTRAARIRRAAAVRRVAVVAKEQRALQLTCDATALRSATSSFQALISSSPGGGAAATKGGSPKVAVPRGTAGVGEEHIIALRRRVVEELSGGSSESRGRRASVQKIVETVRRGSVQVRRGSVQMVERALKRPGSPPGYGTRIDSDGMRGPISPTFTSDGTRGEGGNKMGGVDTGKEIGTAIVSSLGEEGGDGGVTVVGTCEKQGAPQEEEGASGATRSTSGVDELQAQDLREEGPVLRLENPTKGGPSQQQQTAHSRRNIDSTGDAGTASTNRNVSLEELLGAVAGLSHVVEGEGGSLGVAAYAAWWVRAVSDAELELKKKFLNPTSLGKWGRR